MRAIVLVGGFGTRLRPLTLHLPKQMLPVAHRTMLEHVVRRLGRQGVTEAVLSLGYRPDVFREAWPEGVCAGVRLRYAQEPTPLDTAGAIRFAAHAAGVDERMIVVNGDVLTSLDVGVLLARHEAAGAAATIHLTAVADPSRFGVVPTDERGRVLEFVEKPAPGTAPTDRINAGTYILEPEVLDEIPLGEKTSIERETFPYLAAAGRLFAFATDDYWLDAGTPAAYLSAHLDALRGAWEPPAVPVASTATVDPSARVDRSLVHAGAVVGPGAELIDSVVLPGAIIGRGARVEGSIVGGEGRVGDGAHLAGLSVVGYGEEVPAGSFLDGRTVPPPEEWPSP